MAYTTYIRLNKGMSKGALLARAGSPDSESVQNIKDDVIRTFDYMPTSDDPYVTTVRVQGGVIVGIERTKKN